MFRRNFLSFFHISSFYPFKVLLNGSFFFFFNEVTRMVALLKERGHLRAGRKVSAGRDLETAAMKQYGGLIETVCKPIFAHI